MIQEKAKFLRMLGDETKLKIIQALLQGEICACEFVAVTGKAQSTISTQLIDLEAKGILASRKVGKNRYYSIKDPLVYKLCDLLGIRKKTKGYKHEQTKRDCTNDTILA